MNTLEQALLHPSGSGGFLSGLSLNQKHAFLAYWRLSDQQPTRFSLSPDEYLIVSPVDKDPFSPILALGTTLLLSYNTSAVPLVAGYQNGGDFLSASSSLLPENQFMQTALLKLSDDSFSYAFYTSQYRKGKDCPQQCSQHFSQFSHPQPGTGHLLWDDVLLPIPVPLPDTLTQLGDLLWEKLLPLHPHCALYTYELNCTTAVTGIRILQTQ